MDKIPYMLVVGEKDMAARVVSPRTREGQQQPASPVDEFARRLAEEARTPVPGRSIIPPAAAANGGALA
jgi:threonyl-tRNA synthetase